MWGKGAWAGRWRTYWVASLLLWSVSYVVITLRVLVSDRPPMMGDMSVRRAVFTLMAVAASVLIAWVLDGSKRWPFAARVALALVLSLVGGLAYGAVNYVGFYFVFARWGDAPEPTYILILGSLAFWVFGVWCAIYFAINYDAELRERTVKLYAAQALALEAENRLLRSQINPHFLFNTLNALSGLVLEGRNERAERMIALLSRVLRRSLAGDLPDLVPLREELRMQREYLRIEQIRFGRRLRVIEQAPEPLRDLLVPALILQPLVENAVKHGLSTTERPVRVRIVASLTVGRLEIAVEDDAPGLAGSRAPKLGIGLNNVERRLRVLYGDDASLVSGRAAPHGFRSCISIPARRA